MSILWNFDVIRFMCSLTMIWERRKWRWGWIFNLNQLTNVLLWRYLKKLSKNQLQSCIYDPFSLLSKVNILDAKSIPKWFSLLWSALFTNKFSLFNRKMTTSIKFSSFWSSFCIKYTISLIEENSQVTSRDTQEIYFKKLISNIKNLFNSLFLGIS